MSASPGGEPLHGRDPTQKAPDALPKGGRVHRYIVHPSRGKGTAPSLPSREEEEGWEASAASRGTRVLPPALQLTRSPTRLLPAVFPGCVSFTHMDQSVAIQETLAEGEYCVLISFPALSSQPWRLRGPWEGEWTRLCVSLLPSLSQGPWRRRKSVFTGSVLASAHCSKHSTVLRIPCEAGHYHPHFADERESEGRSDRPKVTWRMRASS